MTRRNLFRTLLGAMATPFVARFGTPGVQFETMLESVSVKLSSFRNSAGEPIEIDVDRPVIKETRFKQLGPFTWNCEVIYHRKEA